MLAWESVQDVSLSMLNQFHWLPEIIQAQLKVLTVVHKVLHRLDASYLQGYEFMDKLLCAFR